MHYSACLFVDWSFIHAYSRVVNIGSHHGGELEGRWEMAHVGWGFVA